MFNLREVRQSRNVTRPDLAKYLGVSESAIAQWELLNRKPDYEYLLKIATYLKCSLEDLVGYPESSSEPTPADKLLSEALYNATELEKLRAARFILMLRETEKENASSAAATAKKA